MDKLNTVTHIYGMKINENKTKVMCISKKELTRLIGRWSESETSGLLLFLLLLLTRRMAIANGTCISFCNQYKAHYLATSRESRRYVVALGRCGCCYLAMSRESKAHFGLLWVRPWDNRGKCYMDRKRIQCLSNASQHVPIYLQQFPSNSSRKFKSSPF